MAAEALSPVGVCDVGAATTGINGTVLAPMTKDPDRSRVMGIPAIVTADSPGVIVYPAIIKAFEATSIFWSPMLTTDACPDPRRAVDMGIVLSPMARSPDGCRLTTVPEMSIPGLPADMVVPATGMPDGLAGKV